MAMFDIIGNFVFPNGGNLSNKEKQQEEKKHQEQSLEMMYMYQLYYGAIEENKYALRGSVLSCQYGTKYAKLDCLKDHGVYKGKNPVMAITDCAESNIHNFGSCLCPESNYAGRLPMTIGQDSNGVVAIKAPQNTYAHICVPVIGKNSVWHQAGSDVLIEVNQKGYVPMLLDDAVLVCQYGGIIRIKEVPDATEENVIIIGGWLRLYSNPTLDAKGRSVAKHPKANNYDWAMPEELIDTAIAKGTLPLNSRDDIEKVNKGKVQVNFEKNNVYIDGDERYWIAIGPNFMNKNRKDVDPKAVEMKYGTKIDIHVVNQQDCKNYYIPAVVGDCKAHSYNKDDPNSCGYYQTGIPYPDAKGRDTVKGDKSTVEFIGYNITTFVDKVGKSKSTVNQTNDYKLVELIIYDGAFNYR
jgi:hypothetical protein